MVLKISPRMIVIYFYENNGCDVLPGPPSIKQDLIDGPDRTEMDSWGLLHDYLGMIMWELPPGQH